MENAGVISWKNIWNTLTVCQNPEMKNQSVPTLSMVQNGVGKAFMTPQIFSNMELFIF